MYIKQKLILLLNISTSELDTSYINL